MDKHSFSTLVDVLSCRALHHPNQLAYLFLADGEVQGTHLTYRELDQQARAIAAQLQILGASGKRSLLLYQPGLDYVAAFFGCLYAGVTAVPAYPPRTNQSLPRLQAIVADSQSVIALTTAEVQSNIERQVSQSPTLRQLNWIATDQVVIDFSHVWQKPEIEKDTLAFLQYTSGSTGSPKGVMVSHGNLLHNLELIYKGFGHTAESKGVIWLPPYHDMGLIGGLLQPLYGAFPVILMSPVAFLQKPLRWLQAISQHKATTSGGPNFAYELCLRKVTDEQRAMLDLSHWEVAFNGAEPIRSQTLDRFADVFASCGFRREAFYPCYGMAETTLMVSGRYKDEVPTLEVVQTQALQQHLVRPASQTDADAQTLVSCGKPLLDLQVAIAHPERLTRCSPDEVGEIWVAGPSVAKGYWNQPTQTEHSFQAYLQDTGEGPYLRTGDLGFLKDGELFVTGRLKDLIIIRGRNHYPQDIELTVAQSHSALRPDAGAAFAVEVQDEECLVIVQEVERSYLRSLDVDAVAGAIRQALSEQHELQVYAVVLVKTGSIPKTSSGKIQRRACREFFLTDGLVVVGQWYARVTAKQSSSDGSDPTNRSLRNTPGEVPPTVTIQDWLITRLAQRLGIATVEIDIQQPFSFYGLDSMDAVELVGDLEAWLGRSLSPTILWDYSSIQTLADYLGQATPKEPEPLPDPKADQSDRNAELDQLLTELEQLSEEDARIAFGK